MTFHSSSKFQKVNCAGRPLPVWQKIHVVPFNMESIDNKLKMNSRGICISPNLPNLRYKLTRFSNFKKAEATGHESRIDTKLGSVRAPTIGNG